MSMLHSLSAHEYVGNGDGVDTQVVGKVKLSFFLLDAFVFGLCFSNTFV